MGKAQTKKEDNRELVEAVTSGVEAALKISMPPGAGEKLAKLSEAHESRYVYHDDKVAVLDISTNALALIDGIPPFYEVDVDASEPGGKFTRQGLMRVHRYEVKLNFVPKREYIYEFTVVGKKEWLEEAAKKQTSFGLSTEQAVAALMRRSVDE